jgi:hypothetical protein
MPGVNNGISGDYYTWQGSRRIVNLSSQFVGRAILLNRPFSLTPYWQSTLIDVGLCLWEDIATFEIVKFRLIDHATSLFYSIHSTIQYHKFRARR